MSISILSILLALWLLPFFIVLSSSKVSGGEKAAWLLAIFFISWFAWILYLLLAPLKPKETSSRNSNYRDPNQR